MNRHTKPLLLSFVYAFLLVLVLSGIGLFEPLFNYPLFPGIWLAGTIFSSGVESDHRLRFELAAVAFNTLFYGLAIFFLFFFKRRVRQQRVRRTPGRLQ